MPPPVGTILDRHYNAAHADHIHVEPPTKMTGTPPETNPGMTSGIQVIYAALEKRFGPGEYFLDRNGRYVGNDPGVAWTHMGGWNRRRIGGSSSWSQHAWWNALDIGPYIGTDQDKFLNFLTGNDQGDDMVDHRHAPMPGDLPRSWANESWDEYAEHSGTKDDTRGHTMYREDISWVWQRLIKPLESSVARLEREVDQLKAQNGGGTTDTVARSAIQSLREHLRRS